MEEPWDFFAWEDIREEHKQFVQDAFREDPEAWKVINYIITDVSCEAASRIEEHCTTSLTEAIDKFKADNPGKEPEECDWLDFVFHYNKFERIHERIMQDALLKEDLGMMMEYAADIVTTAIIKKYNYAVNLRTKATWGGQ